LRRVARLLIGAPDRPLGVPATRALDTRALDAAPQIAGRIEGARRQIQRLRYVPWRVGVGYVVLDDADRLLEFEEGERAGFGGIIGCSGQLGSFRAGVMAAMIGTVGAVVAGSFGILTLFHVLFGELVPKLVAIQRSTQTAIVSIPLLRAAHFIMYPALLVLELCSRAVLRVIGLPFDAYGEAALSEDEILGILAANVAREPRGAAKQELLRRVIRFSGRTAKLVMIPRVDVASLPVETAGAKAIDFVRQQQYSRILLYKGDSLDDVVGYLYAKDLVFDTEASSLPDLQSLRRDALFVPESQGLVDVLQRMQQTHTPFAVVVDEYGGTSGIVTMEDVLEEIVGEIRDELDEDAARIEKRGQGWDVDGRVTLGELGSLGVEVDEGERSESIGAALMVRLKRLPRVGDKVSFGGAHVEVMHIARRRVTRVRVEKVAGAP